MIAYHSTTRLTDSDIKSLRYDCRPGIFIALAIALLGSFFTVMHHVLAGDIFNEKLIGNITAIILLIIFVSVVLGYLMVKKYVKDIRTVSYTHLRAHET